MKRILIVDDEEGILLLVKNSLQLSGYLVDAFDSALKVDSSRLGEYDLILLDIMMPDVDGLEFCQDIRHLVDCPILFLTAKTYEQDLVEGLSIGADDYIFKPFGVRELQARVAAHLRRESREKHHVLIVDKVRFDLSAKQVFLKDSLLPLTKSEYEIASHLAKYKGQVFTKDSLYDYLYAYEERGTPQAIVEHIKNIRAKFKKEGEDPIETVWGIGYKWKS